MRLLRRRMSGCAIAVTTITTIIMAVAALVDREKTPVGGATAIGYLSLFRFFPLPSF